MTEEKGRNSNQSEQSPTHDTLLELYRQLMESQRDNTRIAYSWIGNVFLVLSSALILFGLTTQDFRAFISAMILGIGLSMIWACVTEVFAAYIGERFRQALEVEGILQFKGMAGTGAERFTNLGWRKYLGQARTYVLLFVVLYAVVWIVALVLKF
jgi:hypothetical protein